MARVGFLLADPRGRVSLRFQWRAADWEASVGDYLARARRSSALPRLVVSCGSARHA